MTVSEAAWLQTLEDEHERLKKPLVEPMLDLSAFKHLLENCHGLWIANAAVRS